MQRGGTTAQVSGDVDDGDLTLEESISGTNISATWTGRVVDGSCGKEIRGSWTQAPLPTHPSPSSCASRPAGNERRPPGAALAHGLARCPGTAAGPSSSHGANRAWRGSRARRRKPGRRLAPLRRLVGRQHGTPRLLRRSGRSAGLRPAVFSSGVAPAAPASQRQTPVHQPSL